MRERANGGAREGGEGERDREREKEIYREGFFVRTARPLERCSNERERMRERERERERERHRERERQRERERDRDSGLLSERRVPSVAVRPSACTCDLHVHLAVLTT